MNKDEKISKNSSMEEKKETTHHVAIVTGCSSGIGLETALHLAKNGFKTYATMRNTSKSDTLKQRSQSENLPIEVLQLDVTDEASVKTAINTVVEKEGQIDVLVNNAGYALMGSVEDLSSQEVQDVFNTNVFGVFRTTQAVLPTMRKQKSGRIISISSLAGFMGMPILSAYSASKFAVEGFTESLRLEVAPFGIHASMIEVANTKTNAPQNSSVAKKSMENSPYSEMTQALGKGMMEKMEKQGSSPIVVAKAVLEAATADNPETRYQPSEEAKMMRQARNTKSDKEFEELLMTSFMSPN
ncbi:MAG: SDR family oxidoreductase [Nitrososphaerales archaeon]